MVESQKLIRLFLFQDTIVKPVHFLESIFKQCQTLEHFVFQGYSIIHFSHYLDYTEEQQKTKYPNIKYILIEFDIGYRIYKSHQKQEVFEKFKNYLTGKPNLGKPIQIDNTWRTNHIKFESR